MNDKIAITLTANAGTIVSQGGRSVAIDALHDRKEGEFRTLSPAEIEGVFDRLAGAPPDVYLTTHRHGDHYSEALVERAKRAWPDCRFFTPAGILRIPRRISAAGLEIEPAVLTHDGALYRDFLNCGYFIRFPGCNVLSLGDCATTETESIRRLIAGRRVDLALLNFPWLCLDHGRATVDSILNPGAIAVIHLPDPAEDEFGYCAAAQRAAPLLRCKRIVFLNSYLQTADFSLSP